jgi:hypothetical protein
VKQFTLGNEILGQALLRSKKPAQGRDSEKWAAVLLRQTQGVCAEDHAQNIKIERDDWVIALRRPFESPYFYE